MLLFIMQRMHHDPFYIAMDAICYCLYCYGCTMIIYLLQLMHNVTLIPVLQWMHHVTFYIAMDAP